MKYYKMVLWIIYSIKFENVDEMAEFTGSNSYYHSFV